MKKCVICEEKAGLFSYKIKDGRICKECRKMLPANIYLKDANEYYLRDKYNKAKEKQKKFETTAYYGNLYLDNVHNMLCYSEKSKNNNPVMFGDVFYIHELRSIGLFIANARNVGGDIPKIVCDIKLHIETKDVKTDYVIAGGKKCIVEGNGERMNCTAPPEILMIQNIIGQMIDNVFFKTAHKLEEIKAMQDLIDKYSGDKDWAKGILFLDTDTEYSKEEIKVRFRQMAKIFHPDKNPGLSDEYMKKVNKAYSILEKEDDYFEGK